MSSKPEHSSPKNRGGILTTLKIISNNRLAPFFMVGSGLLATITMVIVYRKIIKPMNRRRRLREAEQILEFFERDSEQQKLVERN